MSKVVSVPATDSAAGRPSAEQLVPAPPKHQPVPVLVNGHLGGAALDTVKELELCVPLAAEFGT